MNYGDHGLEIVSGLFKSQLKLLTGLEQIKIELIEYSNLIDSSDIKLSDWQRIIGDICQYYEHYDGFVIIHGTDTMAYTASILSFALLGIKKPVILTGAQLPLVHRRSDGWNNLIDAIYSAMQEDLHEVAICFNHSLLRGSRAQKTSTCNFNGFASIDDEALAKFGIEISWYKKHWLRSKNDNFTPIMPQEIKILDLSLKPGYTTEFVIDTLNSTDAKGIILQTYGSGNIPINNHSLIQSLAQANLRGTIIVNITQVIEGRVSNTYKNSALNHLGIISGSDMTPEAALAKLWILLSTNMEKSLIIQRLTHNLVGELTED